ncbi:peptidase [Fervidicella metallireducens AeB]|uniref:Peptidase n=1 Tax=Fervidicella metallireducens AeB TaxID=1403537 RepID=A0A017RV22_9CLOT|nr:site-2 protease family protein [Fervidicella metallireducens]EYE87760.1 peptidase [Fervidicella metallireducens AeB]
MDLFDFNISEVITRAIVVIISLTVHEFSHGLASKIQGDKTPEEYGRLTLNPAAHIDPAGLISLMIFKFGWAKPVPISSYNYKNKKAGIIITSIAGPISNLLLAFFTVITIGKANPQDQFIQSFLLELFWININLAVFNLLPIPPLDGSKIFAEIFGGKIAEFIYKIEGKGTIILFLLLWLEPVRNILLIMMIYVNNIIVDLAKIFI